MRTSAMRLPLLAALGAVFFAAASPLAWAQSSYESLRGGPPDGRAGGGVVRIDVNAPGPAQTITIPAGKSASIDLPVDAREVLVTNPKIADAILHTPRRISVLGIEPGDTDAVFFDAAGRRILAVNIRVDLNFEALSETINRLLPNASVKVEGINKSVLLSGRVANQSDADKAVQIAQQFTSNVKEVVNMLTIAGKDQVMLKVRVVEVQRTVIKQLGFNLSATINQLGSNQFLLSSAASFGVNGVLLGGASGGYNLDTTQQPEAMKYDPITKAFDIPIVCRVHCTNGGGTNIATTQTTAGNQGLNKAGATIDAFEQVGLVRTLAEPTLSAVSGESAKFLAGGEFPVPVAGGLGSVSVEFKPYGVGLGFTPVVLSNGRISLKISTEVSELSNQGSVSVASGATTTSGSSASGSSVTVPSLIVRRAETVVELPSGGATMIAGLLKEETQQDISSLPGLMNLPVLGALFNSRDYQQGQTELVIIVTPYIVSPTSPDKLQTPADGLRIASDPETILLGRLNKAYQAPPTADAAARDYQGPAGYVIE